MSLRQLSKSRKRRLRRQKLKQRLINTQSVLNANVQVNKVMHKNITQAMEVIPHKHNESDISNDINMILSAIETYNKHHSFESYVHHVTEGIILLLPNNSSFIDEISKIITHYVYVAVCPKRNKYVYKFEEIYSKGSFGKPPYEYQQHTYDKLPDFKDFIAFILLSDLNACCPSFGPYIEPFKHLEGVVGDHGFAGRYVKVDPLDLKENEFMAIRLNWDDVIDNINTESENWNWDDVIETMELYDVEFKAKITTILLCELYHYHKIEDMNWCSPKGNEYYFHSIIGKVKYELENNNQSQFAYFYLRFHSAYYKYGRVDQRVIRKNWLDLFDLLEDDEKIDCYSFLSSPDWFLSKYKQLESINNL
eukprot:109128_1